MKLQSQAPKQRARDRFWNLKFGISPELGVWDLVFRSLTLDRSPRCYHSFFATFNSRYRSRNCFAVTGAGASVIRSAPLAVLGNAITSRMLGVPQRIAQRRSKPSAMPPCGGAPYLNASSI